MSVALLQVALNGASQRSINPSATFGDALSTCGQKLIIAAAAQTFAVLSVGFHHTFIPSRSPSPLFTLFVQFRQRHYLLLFARNTIEVTLIPPDCCGVALHRTSYSSSTQDNRRQLALISRHTTKVSDSKYEIAAQGFCNPLLRLKYFQNLYLPYPISKDAQNYIHLQYIRLLQVASDSYPIKLTELSAYTIVLGSELQKASLAFCISMFSKKKKNHREIL